MRTLARLQPSLSGQIWLDDRPLDNLRPGQLARRLSIVLTERVDVGAMTGYGLVGLGRHPYTGWTGTLNEQDQQIVQWALHAVRADDLAGRLIIEMSDGERQKVLIARALAQQPRVILLDEPTAFLDLPRRVEVMDLLRQLAGDNGQAILLSTHDLDLALRNADRLWLLSADGELLDGAPEDLILSGAFERVFSAEGVTFDRERGSFHTRQEACGRLLLQGYGVEAFWTRRALERIGYAVELQGENGDSSSHAIPLAPQDPILGAISVRVQDGGPAYLLETAGQEYTFESLDELTDYLRRGGAGGETDAKADEDLHARRR